MSNQSLTTTSNERSVKVREVGEGSSQGDVRDAFLADGDPIAPKPMEFTVKNYKSFRAEFSMKDRDLIVHFFLPTGISEADAYKYRDWWLHTFPSVLDSCAQEYFEAGPPRLMAKYTEELASWWFKAQGYDHLLDPLAYLDKFLLTLDEACLG